MLFSTQNPWQLSANLNYVHWTHPLNCRSCMHADKTWRHKLRLCVGNGSFRLRFSTSLGYGPVYRRWTSSGLVRLWRGPGVLGSLTIIVKGKEGLCLSWRSLERYVPLCGCTPLCPEEGRIARSSRLMGCQDLWQQHQCTEVLQSSSARTQRTLLIFFAAFAYRGCPWRWCRRNLTSQKRTWHCCMMRKTPWSFCPFASVKM